MNIAVVDDNRRESALVIRFLREYEEEYSLNLTISCFLSGEELIASFCQTDYAVVFLDIFMEQMDGIETARKLWEANAQCLVVFLTVSKEHIWQAASLHCFDYIDKKELQKRGFSAFLRMPSDGSPLRALPLSFQMAANRSGFPSTGFPISSLITIIRYSG